MKIGIRIGVLNTDDSEHSLAAGMRVRYADETTYNTESFGLNGVSVPW
jgi:hypothetical protein